MCSIEDEDFGTDDASNNMTPQSLASFDIGVCSKCGQEGEMYKLYFKESECKSCFLQYVNHRFRAAVGSSKALPRNANILLVFDGSAEAIVLLDMLQKAQTETTFKRLHCDFKILFIDDCALSSTAIKASDRFSYVQKVQEFILSYKGPKSYIINLGCDEHQEPFDIINLDAYLSRETDKERPFVNTLLNIRSSTSRNELIKVHRNKLIASAAQRLNCKYVFTPSISVKLATDLLAAIVLGRGKDAALDVAFVDDRLGNGVKLMRPIKDLSESEVLLYMHAKDLKPIKSAFNSQPNSGTSLQGVTELFIQNLQKNYASTVSTVFRTGNKMASYSYTKPDEKEIFNKGCNNSTLNICRFCNSLIVEKSATLLEVEYSRLVSEGAISPDLKEFVDIKSKQKDNLCTSCNNIQHDCDVNLI